MTGLAGTDPSPGRYYRPPATEPFWSAEILASDLRDFCYRFIDLVESHLG